MAIDVVLLFVMTLFWVQITLKIARKNRVKLVLYLVNAANLLALIKMPDDWFVALLGITAIIMTCLYLINPRRFE